MPSSRSSSPPALTITTLSRTSEYAKRVSPQTYTGCGTGCAYVSASHSTTEHALARHYRIDTTLLPPSARAAYAPLSMDDETRAFLASCVAKPCIDSMASILRSVLSVTDVNALLFRGAMFVFSIAHLKALLNDENNRNRNRDRNRNRQQLALLDVGAGDGNVTLQFSQIFSKIEATEISWGMVARLLLRGYSARVASDLSPQTFPHSRSYDCVSLLNLLDRCDAPLSMLRDASRLATSDGCVLVALVLPFSDFVEDGAKRRAPRHPLEMGGARCGDGATFETSLAAFIERVLPRAALRLERLARVPYLCRGDSRRAYYVLSDAIMVLRPVVEKENTFSSYDKGDTCGAATFENEGSSPELTAADSLPELSAPPAIHVRL